MKTHLIFIPPGVSFDFVHFVERSYYPRFFRRSSRRFVLPAHFFERQSLPFTYPLHVSIYRSLISFAVLSAAAPRVTCHPDLVVYHWCHRATAARRIRALQCVSFLCGERFSWWKVSAWRNGCPTGQTGWPLYFPFYELRLKCHARSWNIKLRVFNRLRSPALEKPTRLRANRIHLPMNYL